MRIRHLVATATILAWLALPEAALADCQPAGELTQELAQAPVAFIGTVVNAGARGSPPAEFRVEEVWKGQLPASVQVRGLAHDASFAEDDRTWELGARYLVVPIVDGNVLRDSICSPTTAWQPGLAELRPDPPPAAVDPSGAVPLLPLFAVGMLALVAVGAFVGYDRVTCRTERPGE